jgi:cellulose synthase/poly-beta-1,6-N-acetylglucosamine synthase-like glycosyltransferase
MIEIFQWLFLGYFLALCGGYLLLYYSALRSMKGFMEEVSLERALRLHSGLEPPVSLIVPAYNEATTIVTTVRSLLQLEYPEFEIIVVNDGSSDGTLAALSAEFNLVPYPGMMRSELRTQPLRGAYRSLRYPNVRVLDKANGGKADALNAGINAAQFPLFCSMDGDSVLQRDSLDRIARPFLDDPTTVASGGTVRIANGCEFRGGFLRSVGLPRSFLALCQVVEYLRAFLFGRLGWEPLNGVLVISGAFGLFHKDTVIAAGGYRTDTVGEDMELVVRLHRHLRAQGKPYRIAFVPDQICWTEAPETWRDLRRQRMRWQRGLAETMALHWRLMFTKNAGWVGRGALPFAVLFEFASPVIELGGYVFFLVCWLRGSIVPEAALAFVFMAFGVGVLLSVTAVLLEEISFHVYPKRGQVLALCGIAILENLGYRQLTVFWRLVATLQWLLGRPAKWGRQVRSGTWQRA